VNKTIEFKDKNEVINLEITDEFKASIEILQKTNESIFITGKAGCGKSMLLKYFVSETKKSVAVLAFTGLAAINVEGETIHSFFKFPLGFLDITRIKPKPSLAIILKHVDIIVIDEISMVRADILDGIDKSLRINLNNNEPFGGKQMVFIGDLYQLPPIIGSAEKEVYNMYYDTPYFFSADVFKEYKMPYVNLSKIHRQKDINFINILNSVRESKNLESTLPLLNKRVGMDLEKMIIGDTVSITTTNAKCKEINNYFINKLKTKLFKYSASFEGKFGFKEFPTEEILELKVGSKVMFIKNDSETKLYVNGDVGIIDQLYDTGIIILKGDDKIFVKKATWEKYEYNIDINEEGKKVIKKSVVGKFTQFPVRLAWSTTIHKSQGQSYDNVFVDFHNGTFTSGQAYVALSRCRSLEGLTMKRPMREDDVKLDRRIDQFYAMFKNVME